MNGFELFWEAYPRKTGIGAARKQYNGQVMFHGADEQQMIDAARAYKEKTDGTPQKFIQNPVRFLMDQTYLDPDLNVSSVTLSLPQEHTEFAHKIGPKVYHSWFNDAEFDGDVIRIKEWKAEHIERHLPDVMRVLENEGKRIERI